MLTMPPPQATSALHPHLPHHTSSNTHGDNDVVQSKEKPPIYAKSNDTPQNGLISHAAVSFASPEHDIELDRPAPSNVPLRSSSLTSAAPDAEGSPDPECEGITIIVDMQHERDTATLSSSDQSSGRSKRKLEEDDSDYIRNNPELSGLRRSGRPRRGKNVLPSSNEDEDSDSDIDTRPRRKRRKASTTTITVKSPSASLPQSSAASDSDMETYGSARSKAQTRKHRRNMLSAAKSNPASNSETRFSSRRAAKITTYVEDGSDDFEDDADADAAGYYEMYEDNSPAIDLVIRHRLKEGIEPGHRKKEDFEYNVKWTGRAYYHATWEPYSDLSSLRGAKKVKNYFDNIIMHEMHMKYDENVSLEDKEPWNLDREQALESLNDFVHVERVIDVGEGDNGTEYLVKWKALNYDHCTWEDAALVSKLNQYQIDRYLDRSSKLQVSNKSESNLQTRKPYRPFREQPSYIRNGELREFQITGINFLAHNWCKGNSVILADEMGLGKTVQTVAFINWLRHERQQQGPFLVVVPLSTMPAWAETFDYWTPDVNYVIYTGNETARSMIRQKELFVDGNPRRTKFNVLLTTYDYITMKASWSSDLVQIKWQFLAVDEAHRLKNKESQLYEKLVDLGAPSRLLITGTPVQNNLGELSALMNFLMPGQVTGAEDIDLTSEAASHQINELTQSISPYIIRRTKQKVENDLPPKTEKIIRVELSDVQLDYYKAILTRNYAALNHAGSGYKQSLINIVIELKKASNHPFMFPGVEERILNGSDRKDDILKALISSSGKMMLLDQLLTKMKKDGHRVLIFSQMVRLLDILSDYMKARGHQFQRLDGTIAAGARKLAMDHFNAPESKDFCFLLSTRAGGLGINLMTADTVILFDSDWNPQADLQAMARAHRIGQKKPVTVYRFVSKDTIEEEVIERARNKLMLEFITIQRGVTDKDTSNFKERMAEVKRITDAPSDPDDINRILKRRGQRMFEQSGNQKKLEALDIDAVLANAEEHKTEQPEGLAADGGEDFLKSFEYTDVKVDLEWDQIIPKDQLEAIRAEDKKRQEEKALQEIAEQNAPRKRKAAPTEGRGQRVAKKQARDRAAAEAATKSRESSSELSELDDDEVGLDPNRPLNEKETRTMIRAFERYGYIEEAPEDFVKEAKLEDRNIEVLKSTMNEILSICKARMKDEQDRLNHLERVEKKVLTKKDRKAVLFDFNDVQRINAETLLERPKEMHMVREVVKTAKDNVKTFRVPEATKPATYTSEWGAREDGMLLVGVARYGYGAWVDIKNDDELAIGSKFYLDEHQVARKEQRTKSEKAEDKSLRSPGAVHLVRRINYLLSVLKDKTSGGTNLAAKRALENHHRNTKKWAGAENYPYHSKDRENRSSISASPAPGHISKHRPLQDLSKVQVYPKDHRPPTGTVPLEQWWSKQANAPDRPSQGSRDRERQSQARHSPIPNGHRGASAQRDAERPRHAHSGERERHHNEHGRADRPQTNGERHHHHTGSEQRRSQHRSPDATRQPNGYEHREKHSGHVKSKEEVPQKEPKMEEFFAPMMSEMKIIQRDGHKKSGKTDQERTSILSGGLLAIGDFIIDTAASSGRSFTAACWDYYALHYWPARVAAEKLKAHYNIVKGSANKQVQEVAAKKEASNAGATAPQPVAA